jgi:transporter family-2 protein
MPSRFLLLVVLTVITGGILPIQAGLNSKLARASGSSVIAALISFLVGTVALVLYLIITRRETVQWRALKAVPLWFFVGGLIGAFYVAVITYIVPGLGTALTFSLVVAGQMIAAMVIDHYGWLGMTVKEISLGRMAGVILLIAGVIMIRKF